MFENLSDRLSGAMQRVRGQHKLSEDNISQALREVRVALLEADVALPVVTDFMARVRQRAMGAEVASSLKPDQVLVRVVNDELKRVLGSDTAELNFKAAAPVVIMMAGLQGAGKTTTVAKLARYLSERQNKNVAVVSADVHRPAAIGQLAVLMQAQTATCYESEASHSAVDIASAALERARKELRDVLIIDTAGRIAVDPTMMAEIGAVAHAVRPTETLFVVDAMTGQDAAATAKSFDDALSLTGVVLTKVDGDARGGAALSVATVTGKPIKFLGLGEKDDALEVFHPDRIAQRILGMGDILSLVEEVERKVDKQKAEKMAKKLETGKRFTLADFKDQLEQMNRVGGMSAMLDKMPGMNQLPANMKDKLDDKVNQRMIAIINSMTPHERVFPNILNGSRKRRIAQGSGTSPQDVQKLIKQFSQMQKMMRKFSKGKLAKMMNKLPPGMMPPGGLGGGGMPF